MLAPQFHFGDLLMRLLFCYQYVSLRSNLMSLITHFVIIVVSIIITIIISCFFSLLIRNKIVLIFHKFILILFHFFIYFFMIFKIKCNKVQMWGHHMIISCVCERDLD